MFLVDIPDNMVCSTLSWFSSSIEERSLLSLLQCVLQLPSILASVSQARCVIDFSVGYSVLYALPFCIVSRLLLLPPLISTTASSPVYALNSLGENNFREAIVQGNPGVKSGSD